MPAPPEGKDRRSRGRAGRRGARRLASAIINRSETSGRLLLGTRRSIANSAKILADSYLKTSDADLWLWSDLDASTEQMLAPDFKPLPTLE